MKRRWLWSILLLVGVLTAGCTQGISAEEAAEVFIDRLVYQKNSDVFAENFSEGEELNEIFEQQQELFQKNFTEGLLGVGDTVNEQQAEEIYQLLNEKMQETHYTVKQVSETDNLVNVIYQVSGISMADLMQVTTKELVAQINENNQLVKDSNDLIEATVQILKEQLPQTPIKDEPVDVSIQLKKEQGKWTLIGGQENELETIYLAFVAGVNSQDQLNSELMQAVLEVSGSTQVNE